MEVTQAKPKERVVGQLPLFSVGRMSGQWYARFIDSLFGPASAEAVVEWVKCGMTQIESHFPFIDTAMSAARIPKPEDLPTPVVPKVKPAGNCNIESLLESEVGVATAAWLAAAFDGKDPMAGFPNQFDLTGSHDFYQGMLVALVAVFGFMSHAQTQVEQGSAVPQQAVEGLYKLVGRLAAGAQRAQLSAATVAGDA